MNNYANYGLDTEKLSQDPDTKPGKCWCLWCNRLLQRGFSMCFNNWSICPTCVSGALTGEKAWRWEADTWCLKCMTPHARGYASSPDNATVVHLCETCMTWAADALKLTTP